MWRADRPEEHDDFGILPEDDLPESAPAPMSLTSPQDLGELGFGNIAEPAWSGWRADLADLGGRSPLLQFEDSPRTRLELGTTHPGGLAQFITGKTTLLSNLIRDDVALRSAKIAAGAIAAKSLELATARGIDAVHLGIGMAEWRHDETEFLAPVLLRPLAIRRHGRDFELKLRGTAFLNPAFARALETQFGVVLDAAAFAALSDADGAFKPNAVIDRLRGLTGHLPHFTVSPRLVVSSFAEVAPTMVADARELSHPAARRARRQRDRALRARRRLPHRASRSLRRARAPDRHAAAGCRRRAGGGRGADREWLILVVKTLPGTGGTQTVVNAIGTLVGQNRRVLVVSARRASLHGISERLTDIGLAGLAVAPRSLRRDIVRSISRSEKAKRPTSTRSTTRSCACARCCSTTAARCPGPTRCSP